MQLSLNLDKIIPAEVDFVSTLMFVGFFALALTVVGILVRLIIGKNSALNQALTSALGILLIYVVSVLIYTFNPRNLSQYLSPLPFVTFSGDSLVLFSFLGGNFEAICRELLSMVILAFLANLLDDLIPNGSRILTWILLRLVTVLGAMAVHYFVNGLLNAHLPGFLEGHAPVILFCILIFMVLLGILKVVLGLFLTVINPVIGGLYAFFFSNRIGKQISKAIVSTLILSGFVFALEYLGFGAISISVSALQSYVPTLAILMLVWYVIGNYL